MLEAIKYSKTGEKIGTVELPESLFAVTCKNPKALLYEVINMYNANQRLGTSKTKGRSEVQGSTRKLYKQKGSGNARPGNLRTPLRRGGGIAFGCQPKDWYRHIPVQKKRLALKLALTEKANNGQIFIVEDLNYDKPSTKLAKTFIEKLIQEKGRKLVVIDGSDLNLIRSFSNLDDVAMDRADGLYAYEIMRSKYIIITADALKKAEEVFVK